MQAAACNAKERGLEFSSPRRFSDCGSFLLRLVVDGVEVSPAKEYELYFLAGGAHASKEATDAVNRWDAMVRRKQPRESSAKLRS